MDSSTVYIIENSNSSFSTSRRPIKKICHPCTTVCFGVLAFVFLILSTVLTIIVVRFLNFSSSEIKTACVTKDCIVTASIFIDSIDPSIEPCDDFYEFICGTYVSNTPVPDDDLSASIFYTYHNYYNHQLRDIIEDIADDDPSGVLRRSKEAYYVCLNASHQPSKELYAFLEFVKNDLGNWPIAAGDAWEPSDTLEVFLGKIQRFGFQMPFAEFSVESDPYSPLTNIITLSPPSEYSSVVEKSIKLLNAEEEYAEADRRKIILKSFYKLVKSTVELWGIEEADVDENEIRGIIRMYGEVSKVNSQTNEEETNSDEEEDTDENDDDNQNRTNTDYNDFNESSNATEHYFTITLGEMNELADGKVDWVKILNAMFEGIYVFNENDSISADSVYVEAVSDFLINNTYRTIANYIIWKIIFETLAHAGPTAEKIYYDYLRAASENYRKPFRWVVCSNWVQTAYSFALTRLFVEDFVDPEGKEMVEEMIVLVQNAYKNVIGESKWLDQETKHRALKKASAMKRFVGYPDFIFDNEKLEQYYEYIPTVSHVHFDNFVQIKLNTTLTKLREYGFQSNLYKWELNPAKINAEYDPWSNSIWFHTGILQLPFFDETRPAAVNFGMIGSIIGHEIGHGFDNTGKDYDEFGRYKQWWTKNTLKKYNERVHCFVDQYDNYCLDEMYHSQNASETCVDGTQTLGENIADNTGLKAAYKAYEMWIKKYGEEYRLPGLEEYSLKQIFFISFAYMWCEKVPEKNWQAIYNTDEHAPGKFRVIGALSNSEEFNEAFHCPVGRMNNGKDKCNMW